MKKILFLIITFSLSSLVFRLSSLNAQGVLTQNNDVHLFKSGHDKFEDMFREIRAAKSFIHMEYFNFRNDSIANLLFTVLTEKAKEGVEVRCMYDAFGNMSNNQPISNHRRDSIAATGIKLVKWDPVRFPWVNHIFPRDHRKIVVIDGRVGYTGGMNVADYYVDGLPGIGPWRDLHMHIEGAAVNELNKIFCEMWYDTTDELLVGPKYFPKSEKAGSMPVRVVDRWPHRTNKAIRETYINMLDSARKNVRIISPYFVPTTKVRRAIKRAIDRGIEVNILISEKGDIPMLPATTHYIGRKLQKRGARVYVFQNGFHHSKMMTVDDTYATVGSANLDSRSLRCDFEINTVVYDRGFTRHLNDMYADDAAHSELMSKEKYKKYSLGHKFVGWLGNLLTPFL